MQIEAPASLAYSVLKVVGVAKQLSSLVEDASFVEVINKCSERIYAVSSVGENIIVPKLKNAEAAIVALSHETVSISQLPEEFSGFKLAFEELMKGGEAYLGKEYISKAGLPSAGADSGVHYHTMNWGDGSTNLDGSHAHAFWIDGMLLLTDEDGQHEHAIDQAVNEDGMLFWAGGEHEHIIEIGGEQIKTGSGSSSHWHAAMYGSTGFDGKHKHTLSFNQSTIESLDVSDMLRLFSDLTLDRFPSGGPASSVVTPMRPLRGAAEGTELQLADSTEVQTIIFDKTKFTADQARAWLSDNNFSADKIDETESSLRFRQVDPSLFDDKSFRTIQLTAGVVAVVGIKMSEEEKARHYKNPKKPKMKGIKLEKLKKKDLNKRLVYGVVLEPNDGGNIDGTNKAAPVAPDTQNDVYSADEIEKSAHDYMVYHRFFGEQHVKASNHKAVVVESFIAPVDFESDAGEVILKGSWILVTKILDDNLWTKIIGGDYTGFSMEGAAFRTEELI